MNYEWTTEEKVIKDKVASLKSDQFLADIENMETADLDQLKSLTLDILKQLGDIGYLSVALGQGAKDQTNLLAPALEELANVSGSPMLAAESSARLFGGLIAEYAEGSWKEDVLKKIKAGELIGCVAISEPPEPKDKEVIRTTGIKDGDHYLVTGEKSFISNGPIADVFAVAGAIDNKPAFFIIEGTAKGLERGERLRTLGYNGLAVGGIKLNDVLVPSDKVLGPFDDQKVFEHLIFMQDLALTAACLGTMNRAMYSAKKHAESHVRAGKPVFYHQEVRFKFADMLTSYQTSQMLLYRAAWSYSASDREARTILNCAKVFASEAAEQVSLLSMQALAGAGYVMGNPVERAYRESKYPGIAGTTSERARMEIADEQLKKYKV